MANIPLSLLQSKDLKEGDLVEVYVNYYKPNCFKQRHPFLNPTKYSFKSLAVLIQKNTKPASYDTEAHHFISILDSNSINSFNQFHKTQYKDGPYMSYTDRRRKGSCSEFLLSKVRSLTEEELLTHSDPEIRNICLRK
jgi:hypothetical protein